MNNIPKRKTMSDLKINKDNLTERNMNNDAMPNDGEEVRRESKRSTSGQDTVIKPRTEVYRFGKLHSSQG